MTNVATKSNTKRICMLLFFFCVTNIYYFLNMQSWAWYLQERSFIGCYTSESDMNDLIKLIQDTHIILEHIGLTHVLIYGR